MCIRDRPRVDADDVLLAPPEYHGDRTHGRALAYRTFGTDIYDQLEAYDLVTQLLWSSHADREAGILDSYVLVARKRES